MSGKFFIATSIGFLFIWIILYYQLPVRTNNNNYQANSDVIDEINEEIRLLKKLLDFERQELAQIREKLKVRVAETKVLFSDEDRSWKDPIPILVFACNRADAVKYHVGKLIQLRPSKERFPVIVSQDCDDDRVRDAVKSFGDEVQYLKHVSGDKANIIVPPAHSQYTTYYRIARHYKLALNHVFNNGYTSVVITEDDLDISDDFFEYFSATRYLLENDPLLWCVSAWNDNGKLEAIDQKANDKLYRSDFFSGLGWMMAKKTWDELGPIWPDGFWDDWMRDPLRRKGRQCIRPEISRTSMTLFGKNGASKGLFFTKHLAKVVLNTNSVKFTQLNLDYLKQEQYDPWFEKEVFERSRLINVSELKFFLSNSAIKGSSIRIEYTGNIDYIQKADALGIMHDFKAGIPRTAYKGVVSCWISGVRVYLAPDRKLVPTYVQSWEVPSHFDI